MLIVFTSHIDFKMFQMDVQSVFLKGYLVEEVYVKHSLDFDSFEYLDHVYKHDKALYGMKQDPIAFYEKLSSFLLKHGSIKENMITHQL